jgi:hypothetical protein
MAAATGGWGLGTEALMGVVGVLLLAVALLAAGRVVGHRRARRAEEWARAVEATACAPQHSI